jgi:hypothetical protein
VRGTLPLLAAHSLDRKISGCKVGVAPGTPARLDVTTLQVTPEEVHKWLSDVVIERLPFEQMIGRYDRPKNVIASDLVLTSPSKFNDAFQDLSF